MRALILFCCFLSVSASAQIRLKGNVISADSVFPVYNGIYVELIPENKYAEIQNGTFEFTQLGKGIFKVQIKSIGFETYHKTIHISKDTSIQIVLSPLVKMKDEIVVYGTKSSANYTSVQSLNKEQIEKENYSQDIPYLLQNFTSVNMSSDAGAGVGYTNMSVRGSDGTRINVTLNGIPFNDAESHGSFWVNMPDFLSSAESVTLQRGIGASTNGVAAFGANLNIQTNTLNAAPYGEIKTGYGSFNTLHNTVKLGTGLLNNKFTADIRLSSISSDGYIDRASSNLKSYFISSGWYGKKGIIKFNHFTGKEKTFQAWNGVPQDSLKTNRTYNEFTYPNQTDNYLQKNFQLFYSQNSKRWLFNSGLHYTRGEGYYEEYKSNQLYSKYGLDNIIINTDTITETDLIRRRWLSNHFYGGIYSFSLLPDKSQKTNFKFILGGGANQYLGKHFGEVIWSRMASNSFINDKYYNDDAIKTDVNQYLKLDVHFPEFWTLFTDLQYRFVDYHFTGFNDLFNASPQQAQYHFFNPKFGFTRSWTNAPSGRLMRWPQIYAFYGFSHREPVRDDFTESTPSSRPQPEKMHNVELGGEKELGKILKIKMNVYLQYYRDQLILTGKINDVGAYTRTNVDKSYRTGVESEMQLFILKNLNLFANATFSQNKIIHFTEYIDDYDQGIQINNHYANTDIAFSPAVIASGGADYQPFKGASLALNMKYISRQYLDNTQNLSRSLHPYSYLNFKASYTLKIANIKALTIGFKVNNMFNSLYESNGYTFSYISSGRLHTEKYYFPQAGINFMAQCSILF